MLRCPEVMCSNGSHLHVNKILHNINQDKGNKAYRITPFFGGALSGSVQCGMHLLHVVPNAGNWERSHCKMSTCASSAQHQTLHGFEHLGTTNLLDASSSSRSNVSACHYISTTLSDAQTTHAFSSSSFASALGECAFSNRWVQSKQVWEFLYSILSVAIVFFKIV